jgi:hypothetical protein
MLGDTVQVRSRRIGYSNSSLSASVQVDRVDARGRDGYVLQMRCHRRRKNVRIESGHSDNNDCRIAYAFRKLSGIVVMMYGEIVGGVGWEVEAFWQGLMEAFQCDNFVMHVVLLNIGQ